MASQSNSQVTRFNKKEFHILKEISDDSNFLAFLERYQKMKAQCLAEGHKVYNLDQEDDFGNVEYKLKLVNPSIDRVEHLTT